MRDIKRIIVHCSYTPPDRDIGAAEIRKWHTDPRDVGGQGWSDIGYHFVIRRNGNMELGRPVAKKGAHCKGENEDSIGICLVGGWKGADFTWEQYSKLVHLVEKLQYTYGKTQEGKEITVHGHNEFSIKPCPQFKIWRD